MLDGWRNLEELKDRDPTALAKLMEHYRTVGLLHKFAILDLVLGNVDRHANNLMYKGQGLRLIDHGSAFAGRSFDPARDSKSYIPFYLRYLVPYGFGRLELSEKLLKMPGVSAEVDQMIQKWLSLLDPATLSELLLEYGIHPAPSLERLKNLQSVRCGIARYVCLTWLTL